MLDRRPILLTLACIASCAAPASDRSGTTREPAPGWSQEIAPWDVREYGHYDEFVRRVLLASADPWQWPDYWMVCCPSFQTEYAVLLAPPSPAADSASASADAPWRITVVSAPMWHAGRGPGDPEPDWATAQPTDFEVSRVDFPVAAEDASAIAATWRAIVRRARNAPPEYVVVDGVREERTWAGIDGVSYEFRGKEFYGESWSPEAGPAADLIALIDLLATAAAEESVQRDAIVRACAAAARELGARAEALPW